MSIIVLLLCLLISLIKADTCSYPCHYCCINGECREQRQCIPVIEGFIGIILGAICCIGSVVIFCCYLRMYDSRKLYKKALDKITKANQSNITPRSETREDIINVLNTAKVANILHVQDLSKEELYGSSYEGRNLITSRFYISVNEVWNNSKILKKMNINSKLKYGKYFINRKYIQIIITFICKNLTAKIDRIKPNKYLLQSYDSLINDYNKEEEFDHTLRIQTDQVFINDSEDNSELDAGFCTPMHSSDLQKK